MKSQKIRRQLFVAVSAALLMVPSVEALASYSTDYYNTWKNTGNQATDITQIGLTQVGYAETGSNHTKYNAWFYGSDNPVAWCGTFISWCAYQANIPTSTIRKNALASGFNLDNMSSNSFGVPAYAFDSTSAKVGDIIYVDSTGNGISNHVGLVYAVDDTYIYTVEGNSSEKVSMVKYLVENGHRKLYSSVSSAHILFFGRPSYKNTAPSSTPSQPAPGTDTSGGSSTGKPENNVVAGGTSVIATYKTTASSLNIRSGPDTSYDVLGSLPSGTTLEITKITNNWAAFKYEDSTGWVSLKYCSLVAETEAPTLPEITKPADSTGTIITGNTQIEYPTYQINASMNVRSGPATSYTLLGSIASGTQISAIKVTDNWAAFDFRGQTAWVSLKYATKLKEGNVDNSGNLIVPYVGTYKVTSKMNVRSGPGTSYDIIGTIPSGTQVAAQKVENNFAAFDFNGQAGWVSISYADKIDGSSVGTVVKPVEPDVKPEEPVVPDTHAGIYKLTGNCNVRSGPGTSYDIIGYAPAGTQIKASKVSDGFACYDYNGKTGWVTIKTAEVIEKPTDGNTESTAPNNSTSGDNSNSETGSNSNSNSGSSVDSTVANIGTYRIEASMNVRSGPGTGYNCIGSLQIGDLVVALSSSEQWVSFDFKGNTGWVSTKYATMIKGPYQPPIVNAEGYSTGTWVVNTDGLTVRSGPDTTYSAIASVSKGFVVKVTDLDGRFGKFDYNGKTAWISLKYCTKQ